MGRLFEIHEICKMTVPSHPDAEFGRVCPCEVSFEVIEVIPPKNGELFQYNVVAKYKTHKAAVNFCKRIPKSRILSGF